MKRKPKVLYSPVFRALIKSSNFSWICLTLFNSSASCTLLPVINNIGILPYQRYYHYLPVRSLFLASESVPISSNTSLISFSNRLPSLFITCEVRFDDNQIFGNHHFPEFSPMEIQFHRNIL